MTDNDIIAGWLVRHRKTTSEYMLRLKRDGEVFLGPNGFIEPENISAVNVEDLESEEISLDEIEARGISPIDPFIHWMNKPPFEFESEEQKREFLSQYKHPVAPTANELTWIKPEQPESPGVVGHLAGRKLAEKLKKDLGSAKRFYPELFKALDDGKRWYKPWTWEFFRMLGKPKVMKIETRFRGDKS